METKTVLITGSSSGIGKDAALFLKNKGWQVFATARKEKDIEELNTLGLDACKLDVEDSSSIKATVDYVLGKTQNQLYGLVNNAGFGLTSAVEDLTRKQLRKQFEVNVFGLQELTNLLIPTFRKQNSGRIINVSSVAGKLSLPFMSAYSASKFALEALSDALRLELSNTNIGVSLIEPGPIRSKFNVNALLAFENLSKTNSPHINAYKLIQEGRIDKAKQEAKISAKAVSEKILHALENKNPHARYLITYQAYLVALCQKILPANLIDSAIKFYLKKYR